MAKKKEKRERNLTNTGNISRCDFGSWNVYLADKKTICRWIVNFIRHKLTDYDEALYEMAGKVGCHSAYRMYREAVLDKIAEMYPRYAEECNRQKTRDIF